MTSFDPKHPHGHQLRDGRKAEILRTLKDGNHVILTVYPNTPTPAVRIVAPDGLNVADGKPWDVINAPAPKRTWEVVAWENTYKQVVFVTEKQRLPGMWKVVGRYTLPEGEGMEEKDG